MMDLAFADPEGQRIASGLVHILGITLRTGTKYVLPFVQRGLEKDMLTKPRPSTQPAETSMYSGKKRSRSPLLLIGAGVTLMLTLLGIGAFVVLPRLGASHAAAAVNMDCTLIVPPDPLTAKGLATPYQLVATNAANGACNEANKGQAAFVQGAVIDPATGKISIYNPLVIDQGTQPATAPVVPTLPNNGIVALWFGFNGNNLTLQGTNNSLAHGRCVNGQQGSIFGQFAYCNAPTFFAVATSTSNVDGSQYHHWVLVTMA